MSASACSPARRTVAAAPRRPPPRADSRRCGQPAVPVNRTAPRAPSRRARRSSRVTRGAPRRRRSRRRTAARPRIPPRRRCRSEQLRPPWRRLLRLARTPLRAAPGRARRVSAPLPASSAEAVVTRPAAAPERARASRLEMNPSAWSTAMLFAPDIRWNFVHSRASASMPASTSARPSRLGDVVAGEEAVDVRERRAHPAGERLVLRVALERVHPDDARARRGRAAPSRGRRARGPGAPSRRRRSATTAPRDERAPAPDVVVGLQRRADPRAARPVDARAPRRRERLLGIARPRARASAA